MFAQMFRNWWLFLVRGVLAIVFGILAFIWPGSTRLALVLLFGAFALLDGIFAVATSITFHDIFDRWWAILLEGLTGIVIGSLTFLWPQITALVLLYLIAAWAVITGIFEIVTAVHFRRLIKGGWAWILAGLLSVIIGALLFVPGVGTVGLVWLIGVYALTAGIVEMVFAFRLLGLKHDPTNTITVEVFN
jgi:uncharacterized membrane protein HdeD (DUF308 family)